MRDLRVLLGGLEFASDRIAGLGSEPGDEPTPCDKWTQRQLVNHLISTTSLFTRSVSGEPVDAREFSAEVSAVTEYEGTDAQAAFDAEAASCLEVFQVPGAFEMRVQMPWGDSPAETIASLVLVESLTHGWDLARSSGRPADIPDLLAEPALDFVVSRLDDAQRGQSFRSRVRVREDASASDRLVAFLGRHP